MKINKLFGLIAASTVVASPLCLVGCGNKDTKTWNVSFDTRCETFINTIRVDDGGSISAPEQPTKEGWTFGGWFDNEECLGETYAFGSPIDHDLILYAKWENGPIDPVEGQSISAQKNEEDFDVDSKIVKFKFDFNDGIDGTEIQCSLPESTSENISLKNRKAVVNSGAFVINLVYAGAAANAETIEFGLNFTYTIGNQPYYENINGLKATYNGETPATDGFIYLYNGSSVLFGQSGVSDHDNKEWHCFFFKNKDSAGIDITDEAKLSFDSHSGEHMSVNSSHQVTWANDISRGLHWGVVEATWFDPSDTKSYTTKSAEVVLEICDFIIDNDNAGAYNLTLSHSGEKSVPGGWYCQLNDNPSMEAKKCNTTINAGAYGNIFKWDSWNNRIEIYWNQVTESHYHAYSMTLTSTYEYFGYTFSATSREIIITLKA